MIFLVQNGQFTGNVSLQFVVVIAAPPAFQDSDRMRPLLEGNIGRRGIVLRRYIDA